MYAPPCNQRSRVGGCDVRGSSRRFPSTAVGSGRSRPSVGASGSRSSPSTTAAGPATHASRASENAHVTVSVTDTKFPLVAETATSLGHVIATIENGASAHIIWSDGPTPPEVYPKLKGYQKVNNFPASGEISRKDLLALNLAKMESVAPDEYQFAPKSWVIPANLSTFERQCASARRRKGHDNTMPVYIVKPVNSAMGRGIRLVRDAVHLSSVLPKGESAIVQEYIDRPLLIDGFKFDLRIYVLVLSVDPLRVFLYDDGLVRCSTTPYEAPDAGNIDDLFMHLTNYSINKYSDSFDEAESDSEGSKRTLQWLFKWLSKQGKDPSNVWDSISDVVLKTLIAGLPQNQHAASLIPNHSDPSRTHPTDASKCFAIYGFDVLLDEDLKAYVIEVNRSPSYGATSDLDREVKSGVIKSTMKLLKPSAGKKRATVSTTRERSRARLFASDGGMSMKPRRATRGVGGNRSGVSVDKAILDALEKKRCEWEDANCGQFHRIFPVESSSHPWEGMSKAVAPSAKIEVAAKRYSRLIDLSQKIFLGDVRPSGTAAPPVFNLGPPPRVVVQSVADMLSATAATDTAALPTLASRGSKRCSGARPGSRGGPRTSRTGQRRPVSSRSRYSSDGTRTLGVQGCIQLTADEFARAEYACKVEGGAEKAVARADIAQVNDNWVAHRCELSTMYLRRLSPEARTYFLHALTAVIQQTASSVSAVVGNDGNARVQHLLQGIHKAMRWNKGAGLWNLTDGQTLDWDRVGSMLLLGDLTESEMAFCVKVLRLCRNALIAMYLSSNHDGATVSESEPTSLDRS
eukprot:m.201031 g.201031  ORF g.201031 m.201031 type:complete len:803 (+) comp21289_c0_seq1:71-2479(+)